MPNPNASAKFKRKPDEVEAVSATLVLTAKPADFPQWIVDAFAAKMLTVEGGTLVAVTGQGNKVAMQGDMLVRQANGLICVHTLAEFNALYESA